jgi:hypothetical protein
MANVDHSAITDPNIHEPKGVASATANTIYEADGAGSGAWKLRLKKYSITISPAAVSANTTAEQTFTCTGLAVATDFIIGVSKPTAQAGLGIVGWRVTADNTIGITFSNNTGAGITPTASQVYTVFAYRT